MCIPLYTNTFRYSLIDPGSFVLVHQTVIIKYIDLQNIIAEVKNYNYILTEHIEEIIKYTDLKGVRVSIKSGLRDKQNLNWVI